MNETLQSLELKLKDIIGSSVQECLALYESVLRTKDLDGEVVEIGCLYGRTSLAICLESKEIGKKSVRIWVEEYSGEGTSLRIIRRK